MACSKTVSEIFHIQVQTTPDAIAVDDGNATLTYRELNNKANQLAHWMREQGIAQGESVVFLFEPGIDYIVAIIATMVVGGVYVPIDAQTPFKRVEYILNDCKPKIVLTDRKNIDESSLSDFKIHHQYVIAQQLHCYPTLVDLTPRRSDEPICIFYTSGTTGHPKGVLISHQAVVNLSETNICDTHPSDVFAQFYNLASDPSTMEIWDTLLNGGTLLIIPSKIKRSHQSLKQFLFQKKAKNIILPTSYFHQLIHTNINTLDSLKTILFGGEQINVELIKQFLRYRKLAKLPVRLINAYGPTEATTVSCYKTFDTTMQEDKIIESIGKPLNMVRTYVLDENLKPVNKGKMGELYISGINLAIGYLHSTGVNDEKFLPNPFCSDFPFERLYKTGDIVKELDSGDLQFIGRVEDQVKILGYRVHLHEIESQISKYPGIHSATVSLEKSRDYLNRLIAYLVLTNLDKPIDTGALDKFLSQSLPPYMAPTTYLQVKQLPLNASGKIDKALLKELPYIELSKSTSFVSTNSLEEEIKVIWEDLLNTPNIDATANLFDLGADSLMLMSACSKINEIFHKDLDATDILSHPSIGSIPPPSRKNNYRNKNNAVYCNRCGYRRNGLPFSSSKITSRILGKSMRE